MAKPYDEDEDIDPRRRSSDRFLPKFGSDLIKIAVALVIAWFGVKERVSNLEKDITYTKAEVGILRQEVNYLRSRLDGVPRSTHNSMEIPDVR